MDAATGVPPLAGSGPADGADETDRVAHPGRAMEPVTASFGPQATTGVSRKDPAQQHRRHRERCSRRASTEGRREERRRFTHGVARGALRMGLDRRDLRHERRHAGDFLATPRIRRIEPAFDFAERRHDATSTASCQRRPDLV